MANGKPLLKDKDKKIKPKSVSKLKKELDRVFSIFIRQRDKGVCYTCGLKKEWKQMQNGHFVPRQYLATRYSEINCHCQCYACNMLYNGQPSAYAERLKKDYGTEIIKDLEWQRKQVIKDYPYEEEIEYYKALIKL